MAYLKWISDKDLFDAVNEILLTAKTARTNLKFGKNVIDPFSALFEIAGFELDYDSWIKSETVRQAQKTLQNKVGHFHQYVLSSCAGWENLKTGKVLDVISKKKKIIAEIKNKHNTVKGSDLVGTYDDLANQVMPKNSVYKGYTAYLVFIVPKRRKRYNIPFIPSDNQKGAKRELNEKIRAIDGASFYSLVTGDDDALKNLFNVLPQVILECSKGQLKVKGVEKLKEFYNSAFE